MTTRLQENAKTLAALIGSEDEYEAAARLAITISITVREADSGAVELARRLEQLLARTVSTVRRNVSVGLSAEIVVGDAVPLTDRFLRVWYSEEVIAIGVTNPLPIGAEIHPLIAVLTACYACGSALYMALGKSLPSICRPPDEMRIRVSSLLGADRTWLQRPLLLEDTYLAGAGAIGNGFLAGLSLLTVTGTLHIVDPDIVTDGNLNRCYWFDDSDVDLPKARQLASRAQGFFPGLTLVPRVETLQEVKDPHNARWLRRLIVGVDSRRARRHLQTELPGEVFDASTTGVAEVVLHHHRWPCEGACMACIYHEAADELSRERGVAAALGVTLEDVKEHVISWAAAAQIANRYPHVQASQIEGVPYDSLFKELCSEQILRTPEQQHVLAPFAFVSTFAGVMLAVELARRPLLEEAPGFNYWRLSPWKPPVSALKARRPKHAHCVVCSNLTFRSIADSLWASQLHHDGL